MWKSALAISKSLFPWPHIATLIDWLTRNRKNPILQYPAKDGDFTSIIFISSLQPFGGRNIHNFRTLLSGLIATHPHRILFSFGVFNSFAEETLCGMQVLYEHLFTAHCKQNVEVIKNLRSITSWKKLFKHSLSWYPHNLTLFFLFASETVHLVYQNHSTDQSPECSI